MLALSLTSRDGGLPSTAHEHGQETPRQGVDTAAHGLQTRPGALTSRDSNTVTASAVAQVKASVKELALPTTVQKNRDPDHSGPRG